MIGINVIFGEDFRNPALVRLALEKMQKSATYVEIRAVNIFQVDRDRTSTWFIVVHITDSVRREIDVAILILRNLVLSTT